MKRTLLITAILSVFAFISCAQEIGLKGIKLPSPQCDGGKPLMNALKERKSTRAFSPQKLELQMISDLLWAAFGINRSDEGKRTAPSAMNKQETEIYVCLEEGVFKYNAKENFLDSIVSGDVRAKMGKQSFAGEAALVLIYVANYALMGNIDKESKDMYSSVDVGFISQNVYLFCASEDLATVVYANIDKEQAKPILKLKADQKIVVAQCVGYPK